MAGGRRIKVASLYAEIGADDKELQAKLKAAENALKGTGVQMEKAGEKAKGQAAATDKLGLSMSRLVATQAGLGAQFSALASGGLESMAIMFGMGAAAGAIAVGVGKAVLGLGEYYNQQMAIARGGKDAASELDKTAKAIENVRLEAGKKINPIVIEIEVGKQRVAQNTQELLAGMFPKSAEYIRTFDLYRASVERVQQAETNLARARQLGFGPLVALAEGQLRAAESAREHALAEYQAAQAAVDLALNTKTAAGELKEVTAAREGVEQLYDLMQERAVSEESIQSVLALATALGITSSATGELAGKIEALQVRLGYLQTVAPGVAAAAARGAFVTDPAREFQDYGTPLYNIWKPVVDKRIDDANTIRDTEKRNAAQAASAWESEFKAAMDGRISALKGMISSGSSSIAGLLPELFPGGGDPMQDPNGPLMKFRRLADVAKLGDKSPWYAELGESQGHAAELVSLYGRGMVTPEMIGKGYIDVKKLADVSNFQQAAEASQQALAEAIEKAGGKRGSEMLSKMFGFSKDEKGNVKVPDMTPLVSTMLNAVDVTLVSRKEDTAAIGKRLVEGVFAGWQGNIAAQPWAAAIVAAVLAEISKYFNNKR